MADETNKNMFNDPNIKGRRLLQAIRPSHKTKSAKSQSFNDRNVSDDCRGLKRTKSSESSEKIFKKPRVENTPTPRTHSKNLAQHRLQKLRKSLEDKRKEMANLSQPVSPDKSLNQSIYSPRQSTANDNKYSSPVSYKEFEMDVFRRRNKKDSTSPLRVKHVDNKLLINSSLTKSEKSSESIHTNIPSPLKRFQQEVATNIESSKINYSNPDEFSFSSDENNMSMEWSPVTEEKIIENITEIRKEIDYNEQTPIANCMDDNRNVKNIIGIFVVVDTNIFLSDLHFITELKNITFKDLGPTIIVVPWMVIQELDYMKDGRTCSRSLVTNSTKAINFINNYLTKKDPNFRGQTIIEATQQDISGSTPDDGILFCCLQLARQGKNVVLLSNDKNLRNKVLVNKLMAYSKDEIIKSLKNLANSEKKGECKSGLRSIEKIQMILSNILSMIIEKEMKDAYGDIWTKMACVMPPLTVSEAVNCMKKYWVAVFSFQLLKQCKQCVDEFRVFLSQIGNCDMLTQDNYNKYIEFCLKFCIYLKTGYPLFKREVCEAIQKIQNHAT